MSHEIDNKTKLPACAIEGSCCWRHWEGMQQTSRHRRGLHGTRSTMSKMQTSKMQMQAVPVGCGFQACKGNFCHEHGAPHKPLEGFVLDAHTLAWDTHFAALQLFKTTSEGNCLVPDRHVTVDGRNLGNWVRNHHENKKLGKLEPDRVQQLEGLGFVWDAQALAWDAQFAALQPFKTSHGNCNVPQSHVTVCQMVVHCPHHVESHSCQVTNGMSHAGLRVMMMFQIFGCEIITFSLHSQCPSCPPCLKQTVLRNKLRHRRTLHQNHAAVSDEHRSMLSTLFATWHSQPQCLPVSLIHRRVHHQSGISSRRVGRSPRQCGSTMVRRALCCQLGVIRRK